MALVGKSKGSGWHWLEWSPTVPRNAQKQEGSELHKTQTPAVNFLGQLIWHQVTGWPQAAVKGAVKLVFECQNCRLDYFGRV